MSKVKIQGNASGTGIFTVAAPATNTDRTITLPDVDATVLTTAGGTLTANLEINKVNPQLTLTETGLSGSYLKYENNAGLGKMTIGMDSAGGSIAFRSYSGGYADRLIIDNAGRITTPYQPRFHAAQRTSQASGIILSFQLAHVNVGGHFNGTRFTCPIAGKYKFYYASLFGNASTVGRWWLFKNGSYAYGENSGDGVQLRIDNSDGHGYPYGERTVIVSANAGDYFEIYFASDSGVDNGSSPGYNTFGGELLG
jgi:hypothetical protein